MRREKQSEKQVWWESQVSILAVFAAGAGAARSSGRLVSESGIRGGVLRLEMGLETPQGAGLCAALWDAREEATRLGVSVWQRHHSHISRDFAGSQIKTQEEGDESHFNLK